MSMLESCSAQLGGPSAPFATAESLHVLQETSAHLEKQLMQLNLEKTSLEADLIRVEPRARRSREGRMEKARIEKRLGDIRRVSQELRRKLREAN